MLIFGANLGSLGEGTKEKTYLKGSKSLMCLSFTQVSQYDKQPLHQEFATI